MQLSHEMIEGLDTHEAFVGPFRVFAYLSPDEDASNPLEDCDGLGKIHHHPRSRYGSRSTDYFEVLGLDGQGDPDLEADAVMDRARAIYQSWIAALSHAEVQAFMEALGYEFEDQDDANDEVENFLEALNQQIEDPEPDWDKEDYLHGALFRDADIDTILKHQHLLPELDLDWDEVWEAARDTGELGDPDAILLDRSEHGLCAYSLHGSNVDPWDTSSCEAVWVPDQCCREEIDRRALVYDFAPVQETNWVIGHGKQYRLQLGESEAIYSDDWAELFEKAQAYAQECIDKGMKPLHAGHQAAVRGMAITAAEKYTEWCNGSVYGVCVDVFNAKTGELVEEDACWGHIGMEWAELALKESFNYMVERAEKQAERVQYPPTTQGV